MFNDHHFQEEVKIKNRIALILVGTLLLAGCAGKLAINDQETQEVADVIAEQESPAVIEEPTEPIVAQVEEAMATDKIFFDLDSYQLTPVSRKALEANALWLQAREEYLIVIEGHADERGSDEYNLALGENRAKAVRDYLMALGVAPERVSIISYGEEKATRGARTQAVWAQDRRAEFMIAN